jgi:hypothetical protein
MVSRTDQRNRVCQGEGGNYRDESTQATKWNNQTEQKQQMVDAAQDVLDAEHDKATGRLMPGRVQGYWPRTATDYHGPAAFTERQIADRKLSHVSQICRD